MDDAGTRSARAHRRYGGTALKITSPDPLHPNGARVLAALREEGSDAVIVETLEPSPTALAAAAQLDITVGQVANSLVFDAEGEPVLILTSGAHRVDTDHVAMVIGVSSLKRASAEFVRAATGQPIGGVAPLGHPRPIRTYLDLALAEFSEVWAAGGHPHYVFRTSFEELLRITHATPISVTPGSDASTPVTSSS